MATTRSRLDVIAEITAPGQPYELTVLDDIRGPVRMFANAPRNLRQSYTDALSDAEFLVAGDERWTFAEFWRDASTVGHMLVNDLGVRPGDRVAISMRNHPEWMLAFTAATSVGAIAVATHGADAALHAANGALALVQRGVDLADVAALDSALCADSLVIQF